MSLPDRGAAAAGGGQDNEPSQDRFLGGRISALQPRHGPRAGIDAVFLAAAVPVAASGAEKVLEAGMGAGVASLALAARSPATAIAGVEIQPRLAVLARRNIELNGFADRVRVIEADVTAPAATLRELKLSPESFDHVMANPPFFSDGSVRASADATTARAHVAEEGGLEKWVRFLTAMAAPGASITLIHRPETLGELLDELGSRFGGLTVYPLYPRADGEAARILLQGRKGSRAPLRLARGMVLHNEDGSFTPEAEAVLRAGEGLEISPSR